MKISRKNFENPKIDLPNLNLEKAENEKKVLFSSHRLKMIHREQLFKYVIVNEIEIC